MNNNENVLWFEDKTSVPSQDSWGRNCSQPYHVWSGGK